MLRIESLTKEIAVAKASEMVSLETGTGNGRWKESNFLSDIPGKWNLSTLLLDELGRIVGYSIASRPDPLRAHLHRIVVAKEYRNRGFGTYLIEELRTRARKSGLRQLSLKVGKENSAAKRLYSRVGFDLVDTSGPYHWMSEFLADSLIVACHQPNFLPWNGYFTKLIHCDFFVLLDDVQIPQGRSYVTRTKVADFEGNRWLTVPVIRNTRQKISDVELLPDSHWRAKHLSMIRHIYAKAPHLNEILNLLTEPYETGNERLADFNIHLIERIMEFLGIRRQLFQSSVLEVDSTSDQRLIDLVRQVGGNTYLSGKGGQNYQNPAKFAAEGIDLNVMEYKPISYKRGADNFVPGLSIIDLVAWQGRDVYDYLRYMDR